MRLLHRHATIPAVSVATLAWQVLAFAADQGDMRFMPAYFPTSSIILFPPGSDKALVLSDTLTTGVEVMAWSRDGKTIYGRVALSLHSFAIARIEVAATPRSQVLGAAGIAQISRIILSDPPGRLLLLGRSSASRNRGILEIDEKDESVKEIPIDSIDDLGPPSPDGSRVLGRVGDEMVLVNIKSGASTSIPGMGGQSLITCFWSPNGRWIAADRSGKLVIIDSTNLSNRRAFGSSRGGSLAWSPDSKRILMTRSELSCTMTLYGRSLEILDLATAKRHLVKSSHCQIVAGGIGWLSEELFPK